MRHLRSLTLALVMGALVVGSAAAQQVYVYPTRGQTPKQESLDKAECSNWAVQQSGFNPMNPPTAMPPPQPSYGGMAGAGMGGAARGAAVGAVGGAIGGDAGKGAAIGAAAGFLFGRMRRRREMEAQQEQQQQYQRQQQAMVSQGRGNWERAYKACLMGRGYTVE